MTTHNLRLILGLFGLFALAISVQSSQAASSQPTDPASQTPCLIPRPTQMTLDPGTFKLGPETRILTDAAGQAAGVDLAGLLTRGARIKTRLERLKSDGEDRAKGIVLTTSKADPQLGDEGYELTITPDSIFIRAAQAAGLFHGVQTLRQLLPRQIEEKKTTPSSADWSLPCLRIKDQPRFGWRGLMLDCSRTFWSMDYLKRTIDVMAYYKMNVFHLHMVDDQGWRIEIRKHPELTRVGARFAPEYNEPAAHQGFYTQDEIRDLVRYAAARHVTIVPEIEMPGHCNSMLAAYPELSCAGGSFKVYPFSKGPGIQKDVLCAGNDKVFAVLEDVLSEVIELFPSKYIHIGGDECPKDRWKACPKCQARIKAEGLKDELELQSYFIRRIDRFLESKRRHTTGWDEILEGGLAPGAAVMAWRGDGLEPAIAAAKMGHHVIMSPCSHCYFDYEQQRFPVKNVYAFEPIPAGLTPEQGRLILGAQGNMWTHIARDEESVDKQIYPRLLALAEVTWSPREARDWDGFAPRLLEHCRRLDLMKISYYAEGEPFTRAHPIVK